MTRREAWLAALLIASPGCGSDNPVTADAATDASLDVSPDGSPDAPTSQDVRVNFRAMVGELPFACGQTFHNVGSTRGDWQPKDFRVYVHDVRLVASSGAELPVTLDDDGLWQHGGVALLDFEDRSGGCSGGTTQINDHITGHAPAGAYAGLRFRVGVPLALGHGNVAVAPSPLNISGMFWSWLSGYIFLKIDGATTGVPTGFNIHLGSTGCVADAMGQVTSECAQPNVADVELTTFNAATQVVVADLGALLATTDINTNTMNTPPGCMSSLGDPECAGIFSNLRLGYGSVAPAAAQTLFSAR